MKETALVEILGSFADAFNGRDAAALAGLFTEGGDLVNIFGMRMVGRSGVQAGHSRQFAGALAGNWLAFTEHTVREVGPGVAVCHAQWRREVLPDAPAGSLPAGTGIFTFVIVEQAGSWKIDAAHNVQNAPPPGPRV